MPKYGPADYLPPAEFAEFIDAFHGIAGLLLFEFARAQRGTRDLVARNFIARADTSLRGILALWNLKDFQDCWILHRCLLDRLFHLRHLADTNEFEAFEAWSFLRQYEATERLVQDPEFGGSQAKDSVAVTPAQDKRGRELKAARPRWRRPKARDVAKSMDMQFMYNFGYDYASTHVHPMANDGDQDFHTITGLEPQTAYPDQSAVLSNSVLHASMLVAEAMSASSLAWRNIVFQFFTSDVVALLDRGEKDYMLSFVKMGKWVQAGQALSEESAAPGPLSNNGIERTAQAQD